jgi:hypothetical protein
MPCRRGSSTCAPEFCAPLSWRPSTSTSGPSKWIEPLHTSTCATATRTAACTADPGNSRPDPSANTAETCLEQEHPAFCGAYPALRCKSGESAVQAMMQLQALAVADLAMRNLAATRNGCSASSVPLARPSCYEPEPAPRAYPDAHQGFDDVMYNGVAGHGECGSGVHQDRVVHSHFSSHRSTCQKQGRGISVPQEVHIVSGHCGEHVELHPSMLRMWDRVRTSGLLSNLRRLCCVP